MRVTESEIYRKSQAVSQTRSLVVTSIISQNFPIALRPYRAKLNGASMASAILLTVSRLRPRTPTPHGLSSSFSALCVPGGLKTAAVGMPTKPPGATKFLEHHVNVAQKVHWDTSHGLEANVVTGNALMNHYTTPSWGYSSVVVRTLNVSKHSGFHSLKYWKLVFIGLQTGPFVTISTIARAKIFV